MCAYKERWGEVERERERERERKRERESGREGERVASAVINLPVLQF